MHVGNWAVANMSLKAAIGQPTVAAESSWTVANLSLKAKAGQPTAKAEGNWTVANLSLKALLVHAGGAQGLLRRTTAVSSVIIEESTVTLVVCSLC